MKKVKYWLLSGLIIILAIIYGVISDRDSTLSKLKSVAAQGDVNAQYALGLMYYYGEHVEVDYKQAKLWYEKAAANNDSRAQVKLGVMYANSLGVNQDYKQAKSWYDKASAQNDVDAQFLLGVMYDDGNGVKQDYHQARAW